MLVMCNCQEKRKRGSQGCFCDGFAFSAFQRISSKLVVGICAMVVGSLVLYWLVLFGALGGGLRPVVTNAYPIHLSLQGGRAQGARVFYRVRICAYRVLRILHIVYTLALCNMCIIQSMSAVHIRGSPVRILLVNMGTPYTHYLSTNGAPTNPHITGWQLKYVIITICNMYLQHPHYYPISLFCGKGVRHIFQGGI